MRIQHNILAMNAYRNYNTNTSALAKNLEKLSSGYKINRAGDDAAGLAISEKMRAQITGLSAASKNVKDGISLVKTAEGAMQEIQDMLNRMDYLATQSANGTYQDEVDREALQKEVNQLNEEINRIAESANFNGIKLLDGTWDADAKSREVASAQKAVDAAQAALEKAKEPAIVSPIVEAKTPDQIKGMMLELGTAAPNSAADVGNKTILETEKIEYQQPSFHANFNGTSYTMASDGTNQSGGTPAGTDGTTAGIKLTVGGKDITLTEADMKAYLTDKGVAAGDIKAGYTLDSKDLAAAVVHKITNDTTATGVGHGAAATNFTGSAAGKFNDGDYVWDVRVEDGGESVIFEFAEGNTMPNNKLNKYYDTKVDKVGTIAAANADAKATKSTYVTGAYTASTNNAGSPTTDAKFTVTVTDKDGNTTTYEATGLAETASTTDVLAALKNAEDADGNKLSAKFDITESSGAYTFTAKEAGANADAVTGVAYTAVTTTGTGGAAASLAAPGANAATPGTDAYKAGLTGYINAGTEVVIAGIPAESEQLASTTLNFSDLDIVDGMEVKLGDTTYKFAVGKDSTVTGENVVDLKDIDEAKLKTIANGGDQASRDMALSKLTEAAKDNATFTVSHEKNGTSTTGGVDQIGLKQKAEVKDTTDMTTLDKFAGYIGVSAVNEAKTQAALDAANQVRDKNIADAQAKLTAAQKALTDAESVEGGKPLNLQIGDTGESFNQLGLKIGSMKTTALKVDGLSIGTADEARAAIDTIKDAINYVSSVRGDLGAYQNRLEHTANNLSVMTENIQDAESTIRDTDIAEEMMAYTKNNILIQSAQAMLAQANAVPQGVLQLLG